jgi:hypothetical protein
MKSKTGPIALQGIEFWCTISGNACIIIVNIFMLFFFFFFFLEIEHDLVSGRYDPGEIIPVVRNFAKSNLSKLLPALFTVVVSWQQANSDDLEDFDDWTPYKAAVLCLTLLSKCCSDSIDGYVLPLITPNLKVNAEYFQLICLS